MHSGRNVVTWVVVTVQVSVSGVPVALEGFGCKTIAAPVLSPGSKTDGWRPLEVIVKSVCPKATELKAAKNNGSNKAQITEGEINRAATCLQFTMNGWKLTTFDSSNPTKAARAARKATVP
jgi:hypothetical protein